MEVISEHYVVIDRATLSASEADCTTTFKALTKARMTIIELCSLPPDIIEVRGNAAIKIFEAMDSKFKYKMTPFIKSRSFIKDEIRIIRKGTNIERDDLRDRLKKRFDRNVLIEKYYEDDEATEQVEGNIGLFTDENGNPLMPYSSMRTINLKVFETPLPNLVYSIDIVF